MTARTPGPWSVNKYGSIGAGEFGTTPIICTVDDADDPRDNAPNAAFIVLACNAHDALAAENARLREALKACVPIVAWADDHGMANLNPLYPVIRAALASSEKGGV